MNSTDGDSDEFLVLFFNREFTRTMQSLSRHETQLLTPGPDSSCASYYIQRKNPSLKKTDFELDIVDEEKLLASLEQLSSGPEAPLLADLFQKIIALSARYAGESSSHEVTPYIYAMF
ncbi:MAG TPA: hypothetical protein VF435_04590 [Pyrinomonadaceae bacterium]